MKKIVLTLIVASASTFGIMNEETSASSLNVQEELSNDIGTLVIPNPGDAPNWKLYYTNYTLNDGWYEKWYKYTDGGGTHYMVKTYNSKGSLMKTRYL